MKPSEDIKRIALAVEDAEIAFWNVIADAFPEAIHGDFAPDATMKMDEALKEAVTLWVGWNADPVESEPRYTEVLFHRIEYFYHDDDMLISDSDEEHIAYCIANGISEAVLCTTPENSDEEIYGYWKINNG